MTFYTELIYYIQGTSASADRKIRLCRSFKWGNNLAILFFIFTSFFFHVTKIKYFSNL